MALPCMIFIAAMVIVVRELLVHRVRMTVIDDISRINQAEIADRTYKGPWRWNMYEDGPSHSSMMLKFWRRPRRFFPPVESWAQPEEV